MSPQSKYWGDVSPLSHRDRRPWKYEGAVYAVQRKIVNVNVVKTLSKEKKEKLSSENA